MLPEGFPTPGGESSSEFIRMLQGMLASFRRKRDEEYEVLGPLSETDHAEWAAIQKAHLVLVNEVKSVQAKIDMIDARRKAFWAKIEADTGIYDKNMRVNDDFILLVEKDKEEGKGGCDGNCHSCGSDDPSPSPEDE